MFNAGIKWLGLAFLAFGFAAQSVSASPLTAAEKTVCKNLRHCLEILKNHDAKSFDYQVLKNEFIKFGGTGKKRLLRAISDGDPDLSKHAVVLLSLSNYEFHATDIKYIADQWPNGDVEALANLMISEYSPCIRQAAIATLTSQNEDIAFWSREILKFGEMDFRLSESKINPFKPTAEAFNQLSEAAYEYPTREITQFLAQYPPKQAQPILKSLLSSKSSEVVHAALNALYSFDSETSIDFLRETVSQLKAGEENIALAVADAVRTEYDDTQDKAFIVFAKRLLTDTSSNKYAAMVGADILMGLGSETKLPESEIALAGLQNALAAHGTVPLFYIRDLEKKLGGNLERGLKLFWETLEMRVSPNAFDFVSALSTIPPNETTLKILQAALENEVDWSVAAKAAEIASAQNLSTLEPSLKEIAQGHPVLNARASALAALDSLSGDRTGQSKSQRIWGQKLASKAKWCSVKPHDFKSDSTQLPFFNATPIAYSRISDRASLSSAISTGGGWLAGYDRGEFSGGLVYYDNRTGNGELIYGQANPDKSYKEYYVPNVVGIAPKVQRPLGQYGEDYWTFTGLDHLGSGGTILSVSVQSEEIEVKRYFELPRAPKTIEQLADNSLLISFGELPKKGRIPDYILSITHPPLRLLPNGVVVPGCLNLPNSKSQVTP
ncbi:HEAT repeat domain-containing protein [Litorimonas haliclonae]|uniref:HEAT repeat domain-containing protein n=1 Tax=Litorimonas haliclonae TaxID=2081977 RepID=UPI0039F11565